MSVQRIVDAVANLLGRPVTLEAPDGRLIAYSLHNSPVDAIRLETLLKKGASRAALNALRERGIYDIIDSSVGLARIPAIPELGFVSRAAMAVRQGEQILAYLWAVDEGLEISPYVETTLNEASSQLAAALLRDGAVADLREGQMAALVADIIGGTQFDEVLQLRAKFLGRSLCEPFQVAVVRPRDARPREGVLGSIRHQVELVLKENPFVLTALIGDEVVLILSGDACHRCCEIIGRVSTEVVGYGHSVVVGVGTGYEVLSLAKRSYREALKAIDIGCNLGLESSCFQYSTLGAYEVVSCMPNCKQARDFGREAIERLIAYDRFHGSSLLLTLEMYLDFYGKRKLAATRLRIHPNTLDYRIRRIRDIVKVDLDDPNVRFLLQLWAKAFRLTVVDADTRKDIDVGNTLTPTHFVD